MNEEKDIVSTEHPLYKATKNARTYWNDVMAGTLTLRAKHEVYMPKFPAELSAAYEIRHKQATFFNMTEKTRNVMVGLTFQAPITLEGDTPQAIKQLWENYDNQGTHGDVYWRQVFEMSFAGCAGVSIDSPGGILAASDGDVRAMNLRPYAIAYSADNIINWRHRINPISQAKELEMVVLKEITNERKGKFVSKPVTRYRVFNLVDGGVGWELWRQPEEENGVKPDPVSEGGGFIQGLTQIPFAVVGELGANPPLLDIAIKNIEHFQTYSDYKNLIHKSCSPMAIAKGLNKPASGETMVVSPDRLTEVSEEGDFFWAEVAGTGLEMVRQSLLDNREEIALMGLSLLADKTAKVDVTATEALLNSIGETAELRVLARNCQDSIELSNGHIAEYMGLPRPKGGSVIMGTAWNIAEKEKEEERKRTGIEFETNISKTKAEANAIGTRNGVNTR
jgi:hypothetical protein